MVLNTVNSYSIRTVILNCSLTSLYLPIILLILHYTDTIYQIGKFSSVSLLCGLTGMECLKFGIRLLLNDISFGSKDSKSNKVKKYCLKLKLKEIFKCIYVMIGSTALVYVLAVLFGAPIFSDCEETLMFALLVSVLCVFPSCLNLGADTTVSLITGSKPNLSNIVSDMISKNIYLTLLGAWLGAVVIPLDWNRPWQVWPIPCSLGAIFGYIFSHVFTLAKIMPSFVKIISGKTSRWE